MSTYYIISLHFKYNIGYNTCTVLHSCRQYFRCCLCSLGLVYLKMAVSVTEKLAHLELKGVVETGNELGRGSYGSVMEINVGARLK